MYTSKKWIRDESKDKWTYNDFGERVCKLGFMINSNYLRYLKAKAYQEQKREILALKHKLEYQQKHYNEVDPVDVQRYHTLVQNHYKSIERESK